MKRLLILVSIIVLPMALSSCSKYSKKNSAYYNSQRAKYQVLDMHAGCPQHERK